MKDQLGISSSANGLQLPSTVAVSDQFDARNEFHGLDLGVTGYMTNGPWRFDWLAKVALGGTFTNIAVNGSTTVNPTQLPPGPLVGVTRPAPRADTSDFWAHGVSVGLAYNF